MQRKLFPFKMTCVSLLWQLDPCWTCWTTSRQHPKQDDWTLPSAPAVVLMVIHGFSLTCCQGSHISMPFRTCILAWNNTYCIISWWTSSGNTPQLSWKAFCICQPSTSHNYLAVGTQRVMGSRLMDTQAFWFLIVIVILSTWGLGNASFEPPLLPHTYTPPSLHASSSCGRDVEYSTAAHFSPACSIKRCNPTEM